MVTLSVQGALEGRFFPCYNPHTHVGEFGVWVPSLARYLSVNKHEIVDQSPEAEQWTSGFLAGNEPNASYMFGPNIYDAHSDDPRFARWKAALAEFGRVGWVALRALGRAHSVRSQRGASLPRVDLARR
jgi:hypothetical protein